MSASEQMTPELHALATALKAGERAALGRAITLVESKRPDHEDQAQQLLLSLTQDTGKALRIGITGVPGVGKSTTIDTFGSNLTKAGHKVAVLAVDPTSQRSGGSILGDKTRMSALAGDQNAFIRPSPTGTTLGGVTRRTRETMLLCEAAGFDIIIVETVGIGQSETAVADMVDFFLVLMLPGAGDELQGIKNGIMEMADLIVINKADGSNDAAARQLLRTIRQAAHVLPAPRPNWSSQVVAASSLEGAGMEHVMEIMGEFERLMRTSSALSINRSKQAVTWMHQHIEEGLKRRLLEHPGASSHMHTLAQSVAEGEISPVEAAEQVLGLLRF